MSQERNFKGIWIPAALWFDDLFSVNEKVVLMEIDSYDNDFGCVASNDSIAKNLNISGKAVSNIIQSLQKKDAIDISYSDYNSFSGRKIHITYRPLLIQRPTKKQKEKKGVHSRGGGYTAVEGGTQRREHSNTYSNTYSNKTLITNPEPTVQGIQSELFVDDKPVSLYSFCVDIWLKKIHPGWTFSSIHGQKIKSIISKLKQVSKKSGFMDDDKTVSDLFVKMMVNLPEYYKDKDLQVIDSKFNEIITEIKKGKNGKQSSYQSARNAFSEFA